MTALPQANLSCVWWAYSCSPRILADCRVFFCPLSLDPERLNRRGYRIAKEIKNRHGPRILKFLGYIICRLDWLRRADLKIPKQKQNISWDMSGKVHLDPLLDSAEASFQSDSPVCTVLGSRILCALCGHLPVRYSIKATQTMNFDEMRLVLRHLFPTMAPEICIVMSRKVLESRGWFILELIPKTPAGTAYCFQSSNSQCP